MANVIQSSDEDFVIIDTAELPSRPKDSTAPTPRAPSINLHTIDATTGEVLVSIVPPREPPNGLQHTPCDIVLVIDVSASMGAVADVPNDTDFNVKEASGWRILDLVKHASRTVLENLNERDRLAIVTFSTDAKVIQGLLPMTEAEKAETRSRIEALTVHDSTNLWAGLREGLDLFTKTPIIGNAQGMYVLTDGVPNHLNPALGFCKKLAPMMEDLESNKGQAPIVSTFGFGYNLRSSLLRSIAEVGRGLYAFIPDAGMIGTVFVHAVANLFSTYTTNSELTIECSNPLAVVDTPPYYDFNKKIQLNTSARTSTTTINLGNVQYGQSRDIVIKVRNAKFSNVLSASVHYQIPFHGHGTATTQEKLSELSCLSQTAMDYHMSRHDLCTFLSSLSFKSQNGEHVALPNGRIDEYEDSLKDLISKIENRLLRTTANADKIDLAALLADLKSSDPTETHGHGQISLALQTNCSVDKKDELTASQGSKVSGCLSNAPAFSPTQSSYIPRPQPFYVRWGQHYLPSILHAHAYQLPMTFKDPGPLRYGINSPLFIKCRDDLDNAFDRLPTPKLSLIHATPVGKTGRRSPAANGGSSVRTGGDHDASDAKTTCRKSRIHASHFNRVDNPCFSGDCFVRCADQGRYIRVDEVRIGDVLWTGTGHGRMVQDVVVTRVTSQELIGLCSCSDNQYAETEKMLWITPWHPVFVQGQWRFGRHVEGAQSRTILDSCVYSLLLEKDRDDMAHTVEVGGVICVTLGHGLVDKTLTDINNADSDVRYHLFFGDYDVVAENLACLDTDECGRRISGGVGKRISRDDLSIEAFGFVKPDEAGNIRNSGGSGNVKARL